MDQAIIFCRTKLDCDNIENYLLTLGGVVYYINCTPLIVHHSSGVGKMVNEYSCVCLHGDRRPQERKDNLMAFKVTNNLKKITKKIVILRLARFGS